MMKRGITLSKCQPAIWMMMRDYCWVVRQGESFACVMFTKRTDGMHYVPGIWDGERILFVSDERSLQAAALEALRFVRPFANRPCF